jgi:hypothetical protein
MRRIRKPVVTLVTACGLVVCAAGHAFPQLQDTEDYTATGKAKYRDVRTNTYECLAPCGGGQECC